MSRPLIIRREQVEALARSRQDAFLEDLARKLKESFPERASALGDAGLLGVARTAVEHARAYGFSAERHLAMLAVLELTLGDDFLEGPGYERARGVLRGGWVTTPEGRMSALLREVREAASEEARGDRPQPPEP
jgi:hypothetical protein